MGDNLPPSRHDAGSPETGDGVLKPDTAQLCSSDRDEYSPKRILKIGWEISEQEFLQNHWGFFTTWASKG